MIHLDNSCHDHFALLVTSYILDRVPDFHSLGFEKKTVLVLQKGQRLCVLGDVLDGSLGFRFGALQ